MQKFFSLSALALLLFSNSALAAPKTFTYCIESSPTFLNPQIGTDGATLDVAQALDFELGTTNLIPSLAEKWDISADGKIYTFYLRKGVKFHKNKEFTPSRNFNADDVLFVFNRQLNKYNYFHNVSGGN
ncbi:peptide ABC transporter substrate-binding protein [Actinobacillus ureae]|nr:peptide ABC transporter substrate-binding protein [Actinobacillus ureae]SUU47756.1 peptide ABC transporter substrate-binding protein [Actinobacillus ureae]